MRRNVLKETVYRSGHYNRKLTTTSCKITLEIPKRREGQLKQRSSSTAAIEKNSMEEAVIEMYLAGDSVRHMVEFWL